jgi:hypothetical protein
MLFYLSKILPWNTFTEVPYSHTFHPKLNNISRHLLLTFCFWKFGIMSEHKPFPFLALPKELRLMVYESLPVKTTYHQLVTRRRATERDHLLHEMYGKIETDEQATEVYGPRITVLHCSIPGLAILWTNRLISSEASVILRPRLRTLSTRPIQIITNTTALQTSTMDDLVCSFWRSNLNIREDIQHALELGYLAS